MSATDKLKAWVQEKKDASVSFVVTKTLQKYFGQYGRILELEIDSSRNCARVELLLKGELEPLTLDLEEYEVRRDEAGTFLVVTRARASREWISLLLTELLLNRRLPIPEKYASLAKTLL